ncbi:RNase P modulator RnpM [Velocimicrobium porci]|uniref:YlxR family protein n=1 Tax=Velocimicrobium porci TaxID=2606634 RepID=A0A6L5XYP0_9FIRM|nr:YlxR family protein [Velocimicrobium porci]MSS63328.1 YlxR family protein [Velocimicrobium porci]
MTGKKVPLRKCIGCGEMKPKKELIRVIKTPEDEIVIDKTSKKNGRGAYICNSLDCLSNAVKTKALERSLKVAIPKEVYETLERELTEFET